LLSEQLSLHDLTIMVGDPITLTVVVPTMAVATMAGDPITVVVPTMAVATMAGDPITVAVAIMVVATTVGDPITLTVVVPTMAVATMGPPTEIGENTDTAPCGSE